MRMNNKSVLTVHYLNIIEERKTSTHLIMSGLIAETVTSLDQDRDGGVWTLYVNVTDFISGKKHLSNTIWAILKSLPQTKSVSEWLKTTTFISSV